MSYLALARKWRPRNFAELAAWLRANTGKAAYGIPSNGTIPHFAGTRIEAALNLPMTRVPYRGSAGVVNDVIGGQLRARQGSGCGTVNPVLVDQPVERHARDAEQHGSTRHLIACL